jgi:hypothetical protein
MNDLSDQYLDKLYDDLSREQGKILTDIKTGCDGTKEAENQRQFALLNTLMMATLKLRNLRQKIKKRIDGC